jgi:hypothetical protein
MATNSHGPYKAVIWASDPTVPGKQVSVWAKSLEEARERLESQYGKGNVFNLYNEEDAAKPRYSAIGRQTDPLPAPG